MTLNMLGLLVIALLKNAHLFLHGVSKGGRLHCAEQRLHRTLQGNENRQPSAEPTREKASTWLPAGCVLKPNI